MCGMIADRGTVICSECIRKIHRRRISDSHKDRVRTQPSTSTAPVQPQAQPSTSTAPVQPQAQPSTSTAHMQPQAQPIPTPQANNQSASVPPQFRVAKFREGDCETCGATGEDTRLLKECCNQWYPHGTMRDTQGRYARHRYRMHGDRCDICKLVNMPKEWEMDW